MKHILGAVATAILSFVFAISCSTDPVQPRVIAVEGVTISPETIDLEPGQQKTVTATVLPSNAANKNVTFSSDKAEVATVSPDGIVEAVSVGEAIVTVTTEEGGFKAQCKVTVFKKYVPVTGIVLDKTSLKMIEGDEFTFAPSIAPENASNKSVNWTCDNEKVATVSAAGVVKALKAGKATITATTVDQNKTASCSVEVSIPDGAVDMGLSVYWASCNVGASKPEQSGGYYQWAGTKDVTDVNSNYLHWSNCPYHKTDDNNDYSGWTKYNTIPSYGEVDNKTVLESIDDIAHVTLKRNWRMPTKKEWDELLTSCDWAWTSNYNGTGVAGRIVTSKKYPDRSIFLPAAGFRTFDYLSLKGTNGGYWSSTLNADNPSGAYYVTFNQSELYEDNIYRFRGRSVRPVSD